MADPKSRITVVEQVYHQVSGDQPHLVESKFSRELESDEQPYERHLKVGEEPELLDCGWVKKASQLLIINEEGRFLQTQPTEAEREELQLKVLEVYFGKLSIDSWIVPPGESMRACPSSLVGVYLRSRSGILRLTLHALPK